MTQHELRELIRRSAQRPLRIHLADGAAYKVSHPDFAFTTAASLILASGPGHSLDAEFIICPLDQITRVEVLRSRTRAA